MISKTNIWYGVGGLFLIVTCVGMYSLIDSEDQDSELLSFLQYDKGSPYSTIRAYKPDDKKKLYLAKLEDSYNSLREQLKPYGDESDDGYTVDFGPCIEEDKSTGRKIMWGIVERQPCVFLKLSQPKVPSNWTPKYLNTSNPLPDDMPHDLKNYIKENHEKLKNMIWLSCDGEFEHNRKNMGKIHYYPHQGFNGTEFQCANNGDCNDPILALKFEGILTHVGVYVVCRTWSANLNEKIRFQIYVD